MLARQAAAEQTIATATIRTNTTVVETNIHGPTDASLLWDTWRVASRLLKRGRKIVPESCPHRFPDRKTKRLYLFITRIVEIAEMFCQFAPGWGAMEWAAVADELKRFLPSMKKVVGQARRSQWEGQPVPAHQRVFSIFEPHTELIQRGRRQKPVEFGHALLLLCQTPEKFITDYEVFADKVLAMWQAFRAGIEGTIPGLKRAFRLARCFYRGFKHFQGAIGLGVFSHKLVVLANEGMT